MKDSIDLREDIANIRASLEVLADNFEAYKKQSLTINDAMTLNTLRKNISKLKTFEKELKEYVEFEWCEEMEVPEWAQNKWENYF